MARLDLSPRDVGRLIDDALAAYRAGFKVIAATALVTIFPVALLYSVAQVLYVRGLLDAVSAASAAGSASQVPEFSSTMTIAYALSGVASLAYFAGQMLFRASLYGSGAALLEGRALRVREMLKTGLGVFLPLLAVQLLVSMVVGAAGVLTIIPVLGTGALAASVFLAVAGPAVAVEKANPLAALSRSFALVRGNFWRVALIFLGLAIVMFQLESALTSPIVIRDAVMSVQDASTIFHRLPLYWKVLEGVIQALAVVLVIPIADLTWLRCYLDLRARNEGMDLLVRAQGLAAGPR